MPNKIFCTGMKLIRYMANISYHVRKWIVGSNVVQNTQRLLGTMNIFDLYEISFEIVAAISNICDTNMVETSETRYQIRNIIINKKGYLQV